MTQKDALKIMNAGYNVLLTGAAGSGKTYLLNRFIAQAKERGLGVAITASTGIAATHLGGRTIHSWAGIGIKESLTKKDLQKISKRSYLKKQFEGTDILIIDEISMLSAEHLDMVNLVCQSLKKNTLAFGGLQIILSGDFFQLQPIAAAESKARFVYYSQVWPEMDLRVCYLEEQHRQNDADLDFVLNALREAQADCKVKEILGQRLIKEENSQATALRLYTHNLDVDRINHLELAKIKDEEEKYYMIGSGQEKLVAALKKNCLAPEVLTLKRGARVMFVKNKFKESKTIYVNGQSGVVVSFDENRWPVVRCSNGDLITVTPEAWTIDDEEQHILAQISQIPLRLAWAITVHKSQGMTLESATIDLSRAFACGMAYVALSRLRSLEGLFLLGISESAYQVDQEVLAYDKELKKLSAIAKNMKIKFSGRRQDALFKI